MEKLGKPDKESVESNLNHYPNFRKYEKPMKMSSKNCMFWYQGINVTYVIGFDDSDRVIFKASGGTQPGGEDGRLVNSPPLTTKVRRRDIVYARSHSRVHGCRP